MSRSSNEKRSSAKYSGDMVLCSLACQFCKIILKIFTIDESTVGLMLSSAPVIYSGSMCEEIKNLSLLPLTFEIQYILCWLNCEILYKVELFIIDFFFQFYNLLNIEFQSSGNDILNIPDSGAGAGILLL